MKQKINWEKGVVSEVFETAKINSRRLFWENITTLTCVCLHPFFGRKELDGV